MIRTSVRWGAEKAALRWPRHRNRNRPNHSLGLFGNELPSAKHCWRSCFAQPPSEGAAFHDDLLGRPNQAALFLTRDVVTSPLMNSKRFRLFFESKVTPSGSGTGMLLHGRN